MPNLFTWTGGSFNGNTVEILYDAAGTKLKKTVKTGATVNYTQEYIGGIEYRDGVREAIYHAEGRLYNNGGTNRYEYNIKDHLGNARLSFTDKDSDGLVEVFSTTANEVLQENHYYPFGLNMDGKWMNDAALDNKYQYNGKEWNDDFGLNLNDYGARWYDAAVGRWWSVDPLITFMSSTTPYSYVFNNVMNFKDPTGMAPQNASSEEVMGADGLTNSQWINSSRPGNAGKAKEFRESNRDKEINSRREKGKGNVVVSIDNGNEPINGSEFDSNNTLWDYLEVNHIYKAVPWLKNYMKRNNLSYLKNLVLRGHGSIGGMNVGTGITEEVITNYLKGGTTLENTKKNLEALVAIGGMMSDGNKSGDMIFLNCNTGGSSGFNSAMQDLMFDNGGLGNFNIWLNQSASYQIHYSDGGVGLPWGMPLSNPNNNRGSISRWTVIQKGRIFETPTDIILNKSGNHAVSPSK